VADVDGDGDADVHVAWYENSDGKGMFNVSVMTIAGKCTQYLLRTSTKMATPISLPLSSLSRGTLAGTSNGVQAILTMMVFLIPRTLHSSSNLASTKTAATINVTFDDGDWNGVIKSSTHPIWCSPFS
jgi:hypothetical protein